MKAQMQAFGPWLALDRRKSFGDSTLRVWERQFAAYTRLTKSGGIPALVRTSPQDWIEDAGGCRPGVDLAPEKQ
jgi:hypothetical protein